MMFRRILSICLAALLAFLPCVSYASGESVTAADTTNAREAELYAQLSELNNRIAEMINTKHSFEFNGEMIETEDGIGYANENLWGTDDYYPFCDALLAASVERSNQIAELFLQEVDLFNELAVLKGYPNYVEYASAELFNYRFDRQKICESIKNNYRKTLSMLLSCSYLTDYLSDVDFLDDDDFMRFAAAAYGDISPEFEKQLGKLMNAEGALTVNRDTPRPFIGGNTFLYKDGSINVELNIFDDVSYASVALHEFGHYLYDDTSNKTNKINDYSVFEIHSIGGSLLCADAVENYFKQITNDSYGALFTLRYLLQSINQLYTGLISYELCEDIFLHRRDYTPEKVAEKCLELNLEIGYDGSFSPEYQMFIGVEWINFSQQFSRPFYGLAYVAASIDSIWLYYQQKTNGTGNDIYVNLINSPITDIPYEEYIAQVGLPVFWDSEALQGADDYFYNTLERLYAEAFYPEEAQ